MNDDTLPLWEVYSSTRTALIGRTVRGATQEEARANLRRLLGLHHLPKQTGLQRVKKQKESTHD